MKLYKPSDLIDNAGSMMLIYGDSGVGKSVSIIQTSPDPIVYIMAEPRSVNKMLAAADRPNVKIKFGFYEGWDDIMEFCCNEENFKGAKTIVLDSLTHLMSIGLSDEILEESYDAMDKKKIEKDLTMRVKMSQEGYGTLSGQMLRLTNALSKLSQAGHIVICIARTEQSPKFDRSLSAAPALKGKEYVKYLAGFMDFMAYCEQRVVDGKIMYPPYVSFESDGSLMAKWTGIRPEGGVYRKVLNINKVLQIAHGKSIQKGGEPTE
jgi:hypothetical protein